MKCQKSFATIVLLVTLFPMLSVNAKKSTEDFADLTTKLGKFTAKDDGVFRKIVHRYAANLNLAVDLDKTKDQLDKFVDKAIAKGAKDDITKDGWFDKDAVKNKIFLSKPSDSQKSLVDLALELHVLYTNDKVISGIAGGRDSYQRAAIRIFEGILKAQQNKIPGRGSKKNFREFVNTINEYVLEKIPTNLRQALNKAIWDFLQEALNKGSQSLTKKKANKKLVQGIATKYGINVKI
jgi:hypothetical protein